MRTPPRLVPWLLLPLAFVGGCGRPAVPPQAPQAALEKLPEQTPALALLLVQELQPGAMWTAVYGLTSDPARLAAVRAQMAPGVQFVFGDPPGPMPDLRIRIDKYPTPESAESRLQTILAAQPGAPRADTYLRHEAAYGTVFEGQSQTVFRVGNYLVRISTITPEAKDEQAARTAAIALQAALSGRPATGPEFFGQPLW